MERIALNEADVAYLVGKSGQTRQRLERFSGARLEIDKDIAVVEGTAHERENAKLAISITLQQRGGAVDGDIRIRPLRTLEGKSWRILGYTSRSSEQLREFAEACDPRLSLASNNCWTFAAKLARYAILE